MTTPRVLLHVCCGPCSIFPVKYLIEQGMEVVALFYNPNIHPLQEYMRRRGAMQQAAEKLGIQVIYKDDEYDPVQYLRNVVFRENSRCFYCYQLRLEQTLSIARHGLFDYFSTTLLYSKFQQHEKISCLAKDIAGQGKVDFFYHDFRQGWTQGIEISKQWGIYRQQYCGCIFSEYERYSRDLEKVKKS